VPALLPDGPYVQVTVSDTGVGMDERTKQNIFDPFFTTKRPGEGTGLGLSMAYGFVKQSNGDIRVSSAAGQGTTFSILLPRAETKNPVNLPAQQAAAVIPGNETILVVEDEDMVRELAQEVLVALGYRVHAAAGGREAMTILDGRNGHPVDLVLSDLIMPGMDGRELARLIKDSHPATKILFMSGYVSDELALREELGYGVPFIQKPYNLEDLARKVREVLDSEH
jgi:two-component system cell cycle sensor histidine kinase/response regulator CckA